MELRHFSHNHGMVFHQVVQGSEIHCSGCKSAGSGNVYVCWQCSYFLHEHLNATRAINPAPPPQPTEPIYSTVVNGTPATNPPQPTEPIYSTVVNATPATNPPPPPQPTEPIYSTAVNATPATNPPPPPQPEGPIYSIAVNATPATNPPPPQPTKPELNPAPTLFKHFSHPHVLNGMEIETENAKVCSACEIELTGAAYCCTESQCSFNLHKTCFDAPREFPHKSHLEHPLTLVTEPPYSEGFTCNACMEEGKAFAYTCATCSYDLHINCVQWPEKVTFSDHKHPLTLYYSSSSAVGSANQEVTCTCDVCMNPVDDSAWVYFCRECNFVSHLDCVTSTLKQHGSSGDDGAKSQEVRITEADEINIAVL
ncbi:PREDICTED: uncharacterized protein LOC105969424 [Erythranthe guttata]|nr:PREDICTED: uncharacterized protein LOC105969424 [Erythranthe guttata]|eukprot:XP_012849632.1 PREDICTED: uncharacterized protein LOC105969424 [Erythranthe guttata]